MLSYRFKEDPWEKKNLHASPKWLGEDGRQLQGRFVMLTKMIAHRYNYPRSSTFKIDNVDKLLPVIFIIAGIWLLQLAKVRAAPSPFEAELALRQNSQHCAIFLLSTQWVEETLFTLEV